MSKELSVTLAAQCVGPYRLEKTLGKGQTGKRRSLRIRLSVVSAPFKAFVSDELSCACLRC